MISKNGFWINNEMVCHRGFLQATSRPELRTVMPDVEYRAFCRVITQANTHSVSDKIKVALVASILTHSTRFFSFNTNSLKALVLNCESFFDSVPSNIGMTHYKEALSFLHVNDCRVVYRGNKAWVFEVMPSSRFYRSHDIPENELRNQLLGAILASEFIYATSADAKLKQLSAQECKNLQDGILSIMDSKSDYVMETFLETQQQKNLRRLEELNSIKIETTDISNIETYKEQV